MTASARLLPLASAGPRGSRPRPRRLCSPPQQRRSQRQSIAAAAASASTAEEQSDRSSALSLENIRQTLIRLEDTIIFSLIERAQFSLNAPVYEVDAIPVPGPDGRHQSLLEYLLRETEQVHGRIRRYTSPDEKPYFPDDVPPLVLPPIKYPQVSTRPPTAAA
jgi:chorismate mutase